MFIFKLRSRGFGLIIFQNYKLVLRIKYSYYKLLDSPSLSLLEIFAFFKTLNEIISIFVWEYNYKLVKGILFDIK